MMNYPLKYIGITYPFINDKKNLTKEFTYLHYGDDFGYSSEHGGANVPIYAVEDGVVIYNRYQSTGGYVIHIRHDNGFVSEYAHLLKDSQKVLEGDVVKKGQQIANMGKSGQAKGNHLHFGLYKGTSINYNDLSKFVNPVDYLYVADWQEVNPNTIKDYNPMYERDYDKYTTGIYQCNYDMRLRTAPTTDAPMLKVKDCTELQKEALTSQNPDAYAVFKKGTNITALEIIKNDKGEYWLRTYRNAYICIDDGSTKYCSKVN